MAMNNEESFQNLEKIMPEIYMIVNELRAEALHTQNAKKVEKQNKNKRQEELLSDITQTPIFSFNNPTCFICNGYYGPCFEDPTCAACHAFLYPNAAPDVQILTLLREHSDDSDSGNDEPADNTDRINGMGDHMYDHGDDIPTPPVQVEGLAQQLSRLSMMQHEIEVNIENLPPEVLMNVFNYLDEISLWSVGQVCVRWREILNMYVRPERWRSFTLLRWPLLFPTCEDQDWYAVYTSLIKSCWCIKCIRQMAAQECPSVEENSWRKHRLRSELRAMRLDPLEGIQAKPLDLLCCHWQATIQGPIGSPYEGGIFYLYIQIPYTYPMCPPVVRFLTKIFHPNVSRHGDIGIDSIHHNWSLALTISKVLISIQSLLTDPYCDVCMEPEVGSLYLKDRRAFEEQARLWTWHYAMHDLRQH
ncbi:hypothetical protein ILUMI_09147 [Ignelater luminosus]|uniref:E2 ubiquitin-conjugating enzyme n=1 Tax=Ignelater luminosus TaxID=2038154 RepID=A0A8K0GFB8_IGNLU|nr:hypothetical protein ILUMI_09147 [Ignelater luminosus]